MGYSSKYQNQIDQATDNVLNFKYDPMQDASYQALSKVYTQKGEKAAKSTMADAASLNGGYGTSYSVSAAQQARNDYNQQLASFIPDLEAKAYDRNVARLSALRDADATAYARYRDDVADSQWQKEYELSKKGSSSGGGSGGRGVGASGRTYGSGTVGAIEDKFSGDSKSGIPNAKKALKATSKALSSARAKDTNKVSKYGGNSSGYINPKNRTRNGQ